MTENGGIGRVENPASTEWVRIYSCIVVEIHVFNCQVLDVGSLGGLAWFGQKYLEVFCWVDYLECG